MLLPNTVAGKIVVVHLNGVAILPGEVPGDNLRNLFLRLWRSSTADTEPGAGRVVKDVDDVQHRTVELHHSTRPRFRKNVAVLGVDSVRFLDLFYIKTRGRELTGSAHEAILVYLRGVCQHLRERRDMDDSERLRQLEQQLAELKARMPAHTVRPAMMMEMEDLEDQIADLRAKLRNGSGKDA